MNETIAAAGMSAFPNLNAVREDRFGSKFTVTGLAIVSFHSKAGIIQGSTGVAGISISSETHRNWTMLGDTDTKNANPSNMLPQRVSWGSEPRCW